MGILNSFRHFAAPALSPVILNISMIAAALLGRDYFAQPITALAIGVMIGGVLQLFPSSAFSSQGQTIADSCAGARDDS